MKKLLIADDEEGVRTLVRMTLELDSFEIFEATDGHRALELAREHQPDLIFLDVAMPGLSGLDVCRELRKEDATARIPVVMLTARAQETDRREGLEAGADHYFTKPFSPVALLSKVTEVLAERQK